ncbi:MAG: hypothetical protein ABIP93_00885 [Gemmatimonadaceae bacterium]
MKRVDEVTGRNASTAESLAATSQELSAQACSLEAMIGQFKVAATDVRPSHASRAPVLTVRALVPPGHGRVRAIA